jgi:hypothetical protein
MFSWLKILLCLKLKDKDPLLSGDIIHVIDDLYDVGHHVIIYVQVENPSDQTIINSRASNVLLGQRLDHMG